MPHSEFDIITPDNLKLYGKGWEPEGDPRAVVCLVHGVGEHCSRYDHMAKAFNRAGYALIAFDLRGHGRSEGKRGHAPDYTALMADITQLLETAKQRCPNVPVFLYGHSLGGNLAIHYALRHHPEFAGVVASAPLLRLAYKPPAWKTGMLRLMHLLRINCSIPRGLDDAALSRDINVARTYRNDPLTHGRITAQLAIDMLRNGEWNLQHAAEFPCPLLLMHGEADRITSAEASIEFAAQLEHKCTLKIWKGLYHEIHNEPEKEQVFDYVLAWMDQRSAQQATR